MRESKPLRTKPKDIEDGLRHCIESSVCDGCPVFRKGDVGACMRELMTDALEYITVLKDLSRTFAQELERRENENA